MANLTVFQGRRCTRVRRAVNGTIATTPTPKAAGSTSNAAATAAVTTSTKGTALTTAVTSSSTTSVFAPTTNFPNQSGAQIATVVVPDIASLGLGVGGDSPSAAPQVTSTPKPLPPQQFTTAPAPAATTQANPPQVSAPAPVPPPTAQTTAVPKVRFLILYLLH
jgi:hypothetical protein